MGDKKGSRTFVFKAKKTGNGTYLTSIALRDIDAMAEAYQLDTETLEGCQRPLDYKWARTLCKRINAGSTPGMVTLSVPSSRIKMVEIVENEIDGHIYALITITVKGVKPLRIIDGQHTTFANTISLQELNAPILKEASVEMYLGLTPQEEQRLFKKLNDHKKDDPNHAAVIDYAITDISEYYGSSPNASIAFWIARDERSPLAGKVRQNAKIRGMPFDTTIKCVETSVGVFRQGSWVEDVLSSEQEAESRELVSQTYANSLIAASKVWPKAWSDSKSMIKFAVGTDLLADFARQVAQRFAHQGGTLPIPVNVFVAEYKLYSTLYPNLWANEVGAPLHGEQGKGAHDRVFPDMAKAASKLRRASAA